MEALADKVKPSFQSGYKIHEQNCNELYQLRKDATYQMFPDQ